VRLSEKLPSGKFANSRGNRYNLSSNTKTGGVIVKARIPILSVAILCVFILSCASSRITSTWKDENYTGGPIETVLVMEISDEKQNRRIFEDVFVKEFKAIGIEALASYTIFPEDREIEASEIKAAARQRNIDRVLMTHLVGVEKKDVYHPPISTPAYTYTYGNYYHTVYNYTHQPGYYTQHEYVKLESGLYDAETETLIWSAATETVDPDNVAAASRGSVG